MCWALRVKVWGETMAYMAATEVVYIFLFYHDSVTRDQALLTIIRREVTPRGGRAYERAQARARTETFGWKR